MPTSAPKAGARVDTGPGLVYNTFRTSVPHPLNGGMREASGGGEPKGVHVMCAHIRIIAILLLVAPGLTPATVKADTIHVPRDYPTIQAGIDAAQDGDTVLVADGVYTGSGNKNLDFAGKAITVRSANGSLRCFIDCEDSGRGFHFHNGETSASVVDGITIANGYMITHRGGGGVLCYYSSPTITNCTIMGNRAQGTGAWGGGVYCEGGNPTITNCTIAGNTAPCGGGVACWDGSPTITHCAIVLNAASDGFGGGIYCHYSSPAITQSTIAGNTAQGTDVASGGGVSGNHSDLTLTTCTITGNTAHGDHAYGGGIHLDDSNNPTITNCTITWNTAYGNYVYGGGACCVNSNPTATNCTITCNRAQGYGAWGGGVYCEESSPTISNCTIAGNTADGDHSYGGGVCVDHSDPAITNSILWDDTPDEVYFYPDSPVIAYCDVQGGWSGTGNIDADPRFADPDNGDYHFLPCSPCIDAGDNDAVPEGITSDLDGSPRFVDDPHMADTGNGDPPIVDMGAYEFQADCPGDLDADRDVDHADLGILLGTWYTSDEGDLDCDGDTDHADLGILLAHWGEGCP